MGPERAPSPGEPNPRRVSQLHELIDQLTGTGPERVALAASRRLLDDELPWHQRRAVHRARSAGMSWAEIGRVLGRSKQAVAERFGAPADVGSLIPPPVQLTADEEGERYVARLLADARRRRAFLEDEAEPPVAW